MTQRSVRPLLPRAEKEVARSGLRINGRGEQTTPDGYPVAKGAPVPDAALSHLNPDKWPCDLCGHSHYPGKRCGANGCECRA